jgi:PAS domain S-box-containing protein
MTTQPSPGDDAPLDGSWPAEPLRAAKLEELLVHGEAAVIATDLDGVITHWNAGAQRLYGWTGMETIGSQFLDLLVEPTDRMAAEQNMESIRQTGGWEGEFGLRRKHGTSMLAYIRVTVIKDDVGRPVGMLGLSMDAAPPQPT